MNKSWCFLLAALCGIAHADERADLAKKLPGGIKAEDIRQTPVPGVYEISHGGEIAYVSGDGRY